MDAETQRKLFNGILTGPFAKERTIILVTHAEWVTRAANQILFIDRGCVQTSTDHRPFNSESSEGPIDEKTPDALSQLSKEQEEDPLQQAEVSDKAQSAMSDLRSELSAGLNMSSRFTLSRIHR